MNIYDIKFLKAFLKTEIYSRDCSSENSVEHMLKKLINIRGFYDFFLGNVSVGSRSRKLYSFCPNFPAVYSFAESSAYTYSLIHSLIHSFILPTRVEHLSCPGQ